MCSSAAVEKADDLADESTTTLREIGKGVHKSARCRRRRNEVDQRPEGVGLALAGDLSQVQGQALASSGSPLASGIGSLAAGRLRTAGVDRAHLESNMAAALLLQSQQEYRRWLLTYVRHLAGMALCIPRMSLRRQAISGCERRLLFLFPNTCEIMRQMKVNGHVHTQEMRRRVACVSSVRGSWDQSDAVGREGMRMVHLEHWD
jgi:hypothetical protein